MFIALLSFNNTFASITVVKTQRASVEVDANQPIDDSYINSLDENSAFEKVTGSYDDELDFLDELDPATEPSKSKNDTQNKRNITSSDDFDLNEPIQN